jgi:hypothetical protein
MSGTEASGTAEPPPLLLPPPAAPAPTPAAAPRRGALWPLWLALAVLFLLLAAGEGYLLVQLQALRTPLAVMQAQLADMRAAAAKPTPLAQLLTAQEDQAQKLAALAAQLNAMQGQLAADHGALTALQVNTGDIGKLTARLERLNAAAAASMALEAGQPLGAIPGAPPALQVFADNAPPTMAQLREEFPAAARAALAASLAANGQAGFWARARLRLEGLVTIADGERVIFGPPAAAALNRARAALANDDLAGAVAALDTLPPNVQAVLASWLTPARQLLAARAALVQMATRQDQ